MHVPNAFSDEASAEVVRLLPPIDKVRKEGADLPVRATGVVLLQCGRRHNESVDRLMNRPSDDHE